MVKSGQIVVLMINPLNTSVALIWRPVIWFAVEINWLVSIWGQHWRLMGSGNVSCKAFPGKWSLQSFCRLFVVSYKPSPENNLIYLCLVDIFYSLREKCPNAKFFLVHIFSHSDWMRRFTSPNARKYGSEKFGIWPLLRQWLSWTLFWLIC